MNFSDSNVRSSRLWLNNTVKLFNFSPTFFNFEGDVTNEADVKRMVDKTIEEFGRLDILVNNAGILQLGSIETTSLEQYDQVMNTNMRWEYSILKSKM